MCTSGKDPGQHFDEWEDTIVDTAKDVWLEIINQGEPEDNGADFPRDKDGFIYDSQSIHKWNSQTSNYSSCT